MVKQCYFQAKLYSKTVFAFKIAYSCFFSLRGNLDFPEFLLKSFITSTTGATKSINVIYYLQASLDTSLR